MSSRLRNWLSEMRQGLRPSVRLLSRRSGSRGRFGASGPIQIALAPNCRILTPEERVWIGLPLRGLSSPRHVRTILVVEPGGTLALDGVNLGRGCRIRVGPGATLEIGRGSYLNEESRIYVGSRVTIGRNCAISWDVQIFDDDGHGAGPPPYARPIVIEDNVWVGTRAMILKGVTIGAGSAVAAGAIVTKSCPPNSLIAGVPARVIREDFRWTDVGRLSRGPA